MSFLITGMGRSGTKWLANVLNQSESWTVRHEIPDDIGVTGVQRISDRFNGNYGEVSSLLRLLFMSIDVDKRCVLLRHPLKILRSCVRWREGRDPLAANVNDINGALTLLDTYIDSGVPMVRLEDLSGSVENVTALAVVLGIDDLDVSEDILIERVNTSDSQIGDDLDCEFRRIYAFDWFIEKYYS